VARCRECKQRQAGPAAAHPPLTQPPRRLGLRAGRSDCRSGLARAVDGSGITGGTVRVAALPRIAHWMA
jgi:hypothetical protein